jgi:pimeloyl-ACP methyl ester carboxylesterase
MTVAAPAASRQPTALLLHGLGADQHGLQPLARELGDVNVVTVDLPGFGQSEPLPGVHSLLNYAAAVDAACARLDLSDVVLVGHSLGASIALTLAATYPERVRTLILLMPVTTGSGPSAWLTRGYYAIGSLLPAPFARVWFLSRLAVYVSDQMTLVTHDAALRRQIRRYDYRAAAMASPQAVQEIYRSVRSTRFLALAASVRAPTLIVGSRRDQLAQVPELVQLSRHIRRSRLVVSATAGHLWPVEAPGEVASLMVPLMRW